jgi:hypothetical protein
MLSREQLAYEIRAITEKEIEIETLQESLAHLDEWNVHTDKWYLIALQKLQLVGQSSKTMIE